MNKKLILLAAGLICLATAPAFCDETNLLVRMGAEPTELVAVADLFNQSVDIGDLTEALGIKHWDFIVQAPKTAPLHISFHWVGKGGDQALGKTDLAVERGDPQTGREMPPPYRDRILFLIFPVDNSTSDPWTSSAKLRIFIRDYDKGATSALVIANPFKNFKGSYATYSAPMAYHKESVDPGSVRQAMGTQFDLMTVNDSQGKVTSSFRISLD